MFLMEKNTVYSQSTSNTCEYGTGEYHKIIMAYNNMVIEIEIKRSIWNAFPCHSLSFHFQNCCLKILYEKNTHIS